MKYAEAKPGRTFVLRLEDGDILHETVERFAREQGIRAAWVSALGGADTGSRLVVGPATDRDMPPVPMTRPLTGASEVTGVGTLFPDEDGNPILHMHLACGREGDTVTGCVRSGVKAWHVLEVVLQELTDIASVRRLDPATGFKLLIP